MTSPNSIEATCNLIIEVAPECTEHCDPELLARTAITQKLENYSMDRAVDRDFTRPALLEATGIVACNGARRTLLGRTKCAAEASCALRAAKKPAIETISTPDSQL